MGTHRPMTPLVGGLVSDYFAFPADYPASSRLPRWLSALASSHRGIREIPAQTLNKTVGRPTLTSVVPTLSARCNRKLWKMRLSDEQRENGIEHW